MKVKLGAVKRAVALVDKVGNPHGIHGVSKRLCRHRPVLGASDAVFRLCGQSHMVVKTEFPVDRVNQFCHTLNFVNDLFRRHENVGVVLCELPHAHQTVQRSGFLIAVYQSKLRQA